MNSSHLKTNIFYYTLLVAYLQYMPIAPTGASFDEGNISRFWDPQKQQTFPHSNNSSQDRLHHVTTTIIVVVT